MEIQDELKIMEMTEKKNMANTGQKFYIILFVLALILFHLLGN
jgi:hypothetical protein